MVRTIIFFIRFNGGSFYYKQIGCKYNSTYRDVDLLINENKDYVVYDILNYYRNDKIWKINKHFHDEKSERFGENINAPNRRKVTGCLQMIGYSEVDLLRDNFDNLLPQFEIIPGVWNYGLSDLSMVKAYKRLEAEGERPEKYKEIKEFFQDRLIYENI